MRGFITHAVNGVVDLFIRVKKKQYESIESFREEARNLLKYFDKEIVGPYILGESISLADLLVYPWFERWVIIEHYFNVSIGPEYVKLQQWILRMQERSSVK
jgi:glutathione S-transferase